MKPVPEKHTISTSTCTEGILEDDVDEGSAKRGEILKDDKKLYLIFDKSRTKADTKEPVYFVRSNGERCKYFYRAEDSKSDVSSPNENTPSPMILSTSSLDVSESISVILFFF